MAFLFFHAKRIVAGCAAGTLRASAPRSTSATRWSQPRTRPQISSSLNHQISSNIIKYHASGSLLAGQSFEASSAEYDSIAISFCVKSGTKRTSSKKKPVDLAADLAAHWATHPAARWSTLQRAARPFAKLSTEGAGQRAAQPVEQLAAQPAPFRT